MTNFDRSLLLGAWFREQAQDDDTIMSEEAFFNIDGSFEITFSNYRASGELIDQITELGDWGVVGDIHFTLTKSEISDKKHYAADLSDADNYHAYQILQLDNHQFVYQHVVTGEQYRLVKITEPVGHC